MRFRRQRENGDADQPDQHEATIVKSKHPNFQPPSPAIEARAAEILGRLTLEEKIDLLGGRNNGTKANAAAGIPEYRMADGPLGVHWWCDSSTAYPGTVMLAAAWDRDLAYRLGEAIGRDARARGVHILLAPGVNIYRSPLCGRNFEYLGEDPCLAAALVAPVIRGCQDQGVAATVKHYAVNFQEYDRHAVSSDADERTLREVYLAAFRAAVVEAGVGCVMTGYNLVNGVHCSEHHHLLRDILQGEWGFPGVTMSDWVSTYSAVGAANAGLDLEMPNALWLNREKLLPAVRAGLVSEAVIDDKIRRLLRLGLCFGWFDHPQRDGSIALADETSAAVAREIARRGAVLLKNDPRESAPDGGRPLLPIDRSTVRTIAVIGPSAHPAIISGGGSAYTQPWRATSILEGLRAMAGEIRIVHAPGVDAKHWDAAIASCQFTAPDGRPGLQAEYFNDADCAGQPVATRTGERPVGRWHNQPLPEGVDGGCFSVRWTGTISPAADGVHRFLGRATDGICRAWLEGEPLLETDHQAEAAKPLVAGKQYPVRIEYLRRRGWTSAAFAWEHEAVAKAMVAEAVAAAKEADLVVFCGGHTADTESEGADRTFEMPAPAEDLLLAVAAVNPATVVVLTAGGHVAMTRWLDRVKALLHAFYPGQEGGTAIAEILFGAVNPAGKLPFTAERQLADRSSYPWYWDGDKDQRVQLGDGIFTGYRHADRAGIEPLFPFGFGLSYTTFAYENARLSKTAIGNGDSVSVLLDVVNTGGGDGAEIVQVYVRDIDTAPEAPRPAKELKGFARVEVPAGQRRAAEVPLGPDAFQYFHPGRQAWTLDPGRFEIIVGASSRDLRWRGELTVAD